MPTPTLSSAPAECFRSGASFSPEHQHRTRRSLPRPFLYCHSRYITIASSVMNPERKDYPISMRLPEADIAMIDRAARLRGRSRTDFVRDAAVRAAEDIVMESRPIRMGAEGFADFMAVLSGPATPVAEIVELAKRPAPWEPR